MQRFSLPGSLGFWLTIGGSVPITLLALVSAFSVVSAPPKKKVVLPPPPPLVQQGAVLTLRLKRSFLTRELHPILCRLVNKKTVCSPLRFTVKKNILTTIIPSSWPIGTATFQLKRTVALRVPSVLLLSKALRIRPRQETGSGSSGGKGGSARSSNGATSLTFTVSGDPISPPSSSENPGAATGTPSPSSSPTPSEPAPTSSGPPQLLNY